MQGLLIALQNLDAVIKIIRGSQDADEARTKLMSRFKLSEIPFTLPRREERLRTLIAPVRDAFDYIFIDCPPSLGLLTLNALVAADAVQMPLLGAALLIDFAQALPAVLANRL